MQSHAHAGPVPVVLVKRPEAIQEARSGLPVIGMEQEIMEAVAENDVILLCGETGSGKTTQVWNLFSIDMYLSHPHRQTVLQQEITCQVIRLARIS